MNSKELKKVAFFFPSHTIGGVEFLYTRIAINLNKIGHEIEIIDYSDGILYSNLQKKLKILKFIEYKKGEKFKATSDVCITSLKYLPIANEILPEGIKLIFWDEHPFNLVHFLRYTRLLKFFGHGFFISLSKILNNKRLSYVENILRKAVEKNGIAFMCKDNYMLNMQYFGMKDLPYYIPIPIIEKKSRKEKRLSNDIIRCSYLGRLDSDKYMHCLELMKDVIKYNNNNKIKLELHIIGDGNRYDKIKLLAEKYPDFFVLKGIITNENLDDYLNTNIDLCFAIGTSALESAALGIPTVFMRGLDSSLKNNYLWVFDAMFYELSLQRYHYNEKRETVFLLHKIILMLRTDNSVLGVKCKNYVEQNHSMGFVIKQLSNLIDNTDLEISDFVKLV